MAAVESLIPIPVVIEAGLAMLELYQAEGCPYCENAREKTTELGLSSVIHTPRTAEGEQRNPGTHEQLRTLGGEDQIPFFVDNQRGETIYESDDIVDYLDEHYS
jgi:glutathione S-transferase